MMVSIFSPETCQFILISTVLKSCCGWEYVYVILMKEDGAYSRFALRKFP